MAKIGTILLRATIVISFGFGAATLDILTSAATLDTPPPMYAGIRS